MQERIAKRLAEAESADATEDAAHGPDPESRIP